MKFCPKCVIKRPEMNTCCFSCGVVLVSDPKPPEERLMMIKVIAKELLVFIETCSEMRKEHEPKIEAITDCLFCREIALLRLPELFTVILNGKNGKPTNQ